MIIELHAYLLNYYFNGRDFALYTVGTTGYYFADIEAFATGEGAYARELSLGESIPLSHLGHGISHLVEEGELEANYRVGDLQYVVVNGSFDSSGC